MKDVIEPSLKETLVRGFRENADFWAKKICASIIITAVHV